MSKTDVTANPVEATYVRDVSVTDPDSGLVVDLEVWKDPESGGMFAIDASFVDQVNEVVVSPFNSQRRLHLSEFAVERRHGAMWRRLRDERPGPVRRWGVTDNALGSQFERAMGQLDPILDDQTYSRAEYVQTVKDIIGELRMRLEATEADDAGLGE